MTMLVAQSVLTDRGLPYQQGSSLLFFVVQIISWRKFKARKRFALIETTFFARNLAGFAVSRTKNAPVSGSGAKNKRE
jgi:hypothetical protein